MVPHGRRSLTISPAKDRSRPTGTQIIGLRGQTRGPAALVVAWLKRPKHG